MRQTYCYVGGDVQWQPVSLTLRSFACCTYCVKLFSIGTLGVTLLIIEMK